MKFPLKLTIIVGASILSLTGCVKSILSDEPGLLDDRNIEIKIDNYWGNFFLNKDSIYQKNGARFKITDVNLLISNFYYNNDGDTNVDWTNQTLTNTSVTNHRIGLITETSVSGSVGFCVGLDTVANKTQPSDYNPGEVLANTNIYGGKNIGYKFLIIKGMIFDPAKPEQETPSIPLNWVVATDFLKVEQDAKKSFSVPTGKQVIFDASFRIDLLFDDLFPLDNPTIKSDPSDQDDYDLAIKLRDNFRDKAFIFK